MKLTAIIMSLLFMACVMKSTNTNPHIQFGGWVTYWDFKRGMGTALQGKGVFQDIFLFSSQLDAEGTPIVINSKTLDYRSKILQLRASGIRTWMTFVNDVKILGADNSILKDSQIVHKIINDKILRRKHHHEIIDLALTYGVSGIDIDYENLRYEDRVGFSRFIEELSTNLKKHNLALSITVQPKTLHRPTFGAGAMDWSEICKHADRLQIMLYNLHGKNTKPGPLATVNWISEVLQFAKSQCRHEIIVPILKVSGMRWEPTEVTAIHHDQVVALKNKHGALLERETTSQVPFFTYKLNEGEGVVYFEDAHSLKFKMDKILAMGFDKLVFWNLGRQDPQLESILKNYLTLKSDSL